LLTRESIAGLLLPVHLLMEVIDDEDLSVLGIPRKESPTPPKTVTNFPRTLAEQADTKHTFVPMCQLDDEFHASFRVMSRMFGQSRANRAVRVLESTCFRWRDDCASNIRSSWICRSLKFRFGRPSARTRDTGCFGIRWILPPIIALTTCLWAALLRYERESGLS